VLFDGLASPFDKKPFGEYEIAIIGVAPHPGDPRRLPVLQLGLGITLPFRCTAPNPFIQGTQVDGPNYFGLVHS